MREVLATGVLSMLPFDGAAFRGAVFRIPAPIAVVHA